MAYQKQTYQDGVTEYTDTLFQHIDDGIFGAYPVQLIAISDTAPSQCVENDKYYNTSTKKIYTATGTNTWGSTGTTPLEDTAYWLISENGSYAWNGTDLVSIGGGKAEVVISDEEPEEGKLWVDTAEIQTIAGRDRLVNVSNEVDEDYRVNLLHSKNLLSTSLELGTFTNSGVKDTSTTNYRTANMVKVKPNTTYTTSINGTAQAYGVYFYTSSGIYISSGTTATFTTPANCEYLNFRCFNADFTSDFANLKVQLEEGSSATTYEPYITPSIYVDNEEIYSKPVILWTNPSPTSDMANNASLTLNSDDYNTYEVLWVMSTSDTSNVFSSGRIPKGKSTILNTARCASGGTTNYERPINYNSDTLLKSGIPYSATASARSATASVLIPYMILGWK